MDHKSEEKVVSSNVREQELPLSWLDNWQIFPEEANLKSIALISAELLIIVIWGLFFTRPYLDLDPMKIPTGREYISNIQTHSLWMRAQECGVCALWDGSTRGGSPAFADLFGSMLHPIVIVTTSIGGVINGSKLALVLTFLMAGFAQWWLGWVLGVGRVARVWVACLSIVGGHSAGRMELGALGLVLSTAAVTLVFPPLITVAKTGGRRSAILLGISLALFAVAGQGYMQFGLLFTLPAVFLLTHFKDSNFSLVIRRYLFAIGLAFLLAAPFLVPFLHFFPEFAKDIIDPEFRGGQPFSYIPLNLVIKDAGFFYSEALQKLPHPYLSNIFIGWIGVLLAVWGFFQSWGKENQRIAMYLAATAVLAMWIASAEPFIFLIEKLPLPGLIEIVAGIRNSLLMAGVAVPPILGLASIGLDKLLKVNWPKMRFSMANPGNSEKFFTLDLRWLLAIPLFFSLNNARAFNSQWISTVEFDEKMYAVLNALRTPDLQWVNPPFGEHYWIVAARDMGLKMNLGIRTWHWKDRPIPEPVLDASRTDTPPGMSEQVAEIDGIRIFTAPPGREYAVVAHPGGSRTVCAASGRGGNINVACDTKQPGTLIVKENSWTGWRANLNGERLPLNSGQWLSVNMPAGNNTVEFRYRPWDVPLGIFLSLVGAGLVIYFWRRPDAEIHFRSGSLQEETDDQQGLEPSHEGAEQ